MRFAAVGCLRAVAAAGSSEPDVGAVVAHRGADVVAGERVQRRRGVDVPAAVDRFSECEGQSAPGVAGAAGDWGATVVELRNRGMKGFGHPEVTGGVNGDAGGIVKLAVAGSLTAPLRQIIAVAVEFLNAGIVYVHHINIVAVVYGNAVFPGKLADAAATASKTIRLPPSGGGSAPVRRRDTGGGSLAEGA